MSALDELIYDRTQTDVTYAAELNRKLGRGEALTAEELADWNAGLKGAYNAADMNRVDAAVRELGGMLTAAGYPVEYVDPRGITPSGGSNEIMLTASDFQSGFLYYASGNHSPSDNYLCTQTFIAVQPNVTVAVRTNASLSSDCGFIWYDSNKSYIGGTTGGVSTLWNSCFQAIPPTGVAYCKFNLNIPDITGGDPGEVIVRQIANPESAGLPEGYTQVEYIESHGAEYIDTGFKPDNDTRIILDVCLNAVVDGTEAAIFGARTAANSNGFYMFQEISATGNYTDGYGNTHSQDINVSGTGRHIIDKNKNKTYIDNDLMHTYSPTTFKTPVALCIMAVNQSSGVDERYGAIKLYSCQIYDNDIIVRCYIPCTNSAGIIGLYDTVSGAFFRDANSSSVEPVELPDGYTQVEYIQSSGTQYIDTGVRPGHNSTIAIDAEVLASSQTYWAMFGARDGLQMQFWVFYKRGEPSWCGRYSSNPNITINGAYAGRHRISLEKNVLKVDNSSSSTSASSFSSNYTSYIFACNNSSSAQYMCNIKLYSAKVFSGSQLVSDFVPCKNNSGVIGLYDLVSEQFYTNKGTGSFTAGRAISDIGFAHGDVVPRPPARDYWVVGDIINLPVWVQYIQNVRNIIEEYYTMPDSPELPEPTAPLTYDGANAIERLIYDILKLYEGMIKRYRICGTFSAGNDYNRQYIRSV